MPHTKSPTMFVTQASPTRRHIFITQSSSRQRVMATQAMQAIEESPLVAACRRYAQQDGGLGKRAVGGSAADAPVDNQETPLVRAARKRAQQTQTAQQR